MKEDPSFAFICITPFQTLNAINFVTHNEMDSLGNSDLYILSCFSNSFTIFTELKQLEIFNHVYYFDGNIYKCKNILFMKICTLFRLLFPVHFLKKRCLGAKFKRKSYTYFCYSSENFLSTYLLLALDYKKKIGIEDGMANYVGNPLVESMSGAMRIANKILFHGKLSKPFDKLYLNNPKNYTNYSVTEICKLPTLDYDTVELLKKVFHYIPNTVYENIRLIYLSQPKQVPRLINKEKEDLFLRKLKNEIKAPFIVRLHPRQDSVEYEGLPMDTYDNLWELECITQISEESILMGCFSTAQFTPKFLFDKEPVIIFLYKLFFDLEVYRECSDEMNQMVLKLKNSYRDPSKILVPENWEEFQEKVRLLLK